MVECGCFYCESCHLDSVCSNLVDQLCIVCQRPMGQSFDIRKKQELNKIVSNITEPAMLLNKVINAIKVRENWIEKGIVLRSACEEVCTDTRKKAG